MITDAIINFFVGIYHGFISLISPITTFINFVVDGISSFNAFVTPILEHTLWFFNVPVLLIAINISIGLVGFLIAEYGIKLALKYFTRLL